MTKLIVAVAIACAFGSPAFADSKEEAKQHMAAAGTAFKEGRYEDTLKELNAAYSKDPNPQLHFSIGQVYVKLDRCADAILAYENFLASKPAREQADIANQAIATCKTKVKSAPPTNPTNPTHPTTPTNPPPTDPPTNPTTPTNPQVGTGGTIGDGEAPPGMENEPKPTGPTGPTVDSQPAWYKDKLGLGLTGGGVVLTIVGLVMYSSARGKIDDASKAEDYGASQSLYDDAKSQRTTSMIVTVIGLGATGVGVWRLMKKRSEEQNRGMAIVATPSGGMITYAGGF